VGPTLARYDVPGAVKVRAEADPETKSSSPFTQRRKTRAHTLLPIGFMQL